MRVPDLFRFVRRPLGSNVLRSGLTSLGVVFGVGSVVLMVAIGDGTHERIREEIERLGTNLIIVLPGSAESGGVRLGMPSQATLTDDDAVAIGLEAHNVTASAAIVRGNAHLTTGSANWSAPLLGVTESFFEARSWYADEGREIGPVDVADRAKVALLGRTVADKLFADRDPLNEIVRVNNLPFRIIGLLEAKGQTLSGTDLDDVLVVPIGVARESIVGRRVGRLNAVSVIIVKVGETERVLDAIEETKTVLRARHRLRDEQPDDFQVNNIVETMKARDDSLAAFTQLLTAVASISLIVGGIGIMNIMIVSVTERTKEIGVRMAVGASPGQILMQFLAEATLLSVSGGVVGAVLGVLGAVIVHHYFGMRVQLSASVVWIAFTFSALVGLVFGLLPGTTRFQKIANGLT